MGFACLFALKIGFWTRDWDLNIVVFVRSRLGHILRFYLTINEFVWVRHPHLHLTTYEYPVSGLGTQFFSVELVRLGIHR